MFTLATCDWLRISKLSTKFKPNAKPIKYNYAAFPTKALRKKIIPFMAY